MYYGLASSIGLASLINTEIDTRCDITIRDMIIDLQNCTVTKILVREKIGPGDQFFNGKLVRGTIFYGILVLQLQNCRGALYDDTNDDKYITRITQKGEGAYL